MKIDKHIEIVSSTVRDLNSMSGESRRAIQDVLSRHYTKVGITIVNTLADLEALVASQPDLVFLGMKYIPEDPSDLRGPNRVWLTSYLDERGIAYTGSGQCAHRLELNKSLAKQRVLDMGLKTSPFYVAKQHQPSLDHIALSFPLFVKPTDRGGGQGVDSNSVVHDGIDLQSKVQSITSDLQADSLVEQYLPGREFSVAILKREFSDEFLVMPIELVAQADQHGERLLSSEVKSSNTEVASVVTDKAIYESVCALALNVFHALGARDYGRIDIRLDESGTPHFLEANLIPSLISGYGSFPKACALNSHINYRDMILAITELGMARSVATSDIFRDEDTRLPFMEPAAELI